MHPNPAFRNEPEALHLNLARMRCFGMLIVPGPDALPLTAHVPFVIDDAGRALTLHLLRADPIAHVVGTPTQAQITVHGPDGYISPDWYEDKTEQHMPTWNYVAVDLRGQLAPSPASDLFHHLEELYANFEARLEPKRPWTMAKLSPRRQEDALGEFLPFRFEIREVNGTWKLGQDKSNADRMSAMAQVRHSPVGHEVEALSAMMTGLGPQVNNG